MLEFKPTKTWLKNHKHHPINCPDKKCYCVMNYMTNNYESGFCGGIKLDNQPYALDNISFCWRAYDIETDEFIYDRILLHPAESLLVSNILSMTTANLLTLIPDYRKEMNTLKHNVTKNKS